LHFFRFVIPAEGSMENKIPVGLLVGVVVASLCAGASATWLVTRRPDVAGASAASPASKPAEHGQIVKLEGFTVNLADPEASHFLRTTLALEVDQLPESSKEKPETTLPIARIRDVILSVLAASKADPLLTPEGKTQLKKSILNSLKAGIPELSIRDVYFTEFLVQR
jgi:flagellar basal body-associated protein FliL